jgi:GTP-binding protein Era
MVENSMKKMGYVAIVGQPNVGKSTLLNHILGVKLCITSRKPQTTRHQILGINTLDDAQVVYVDTPGIHRAGGKAMNRYMNRAAMAALHDVDVIVFVITALHFDEQDKKILQDLIALKQPLILVINKVDKVKNKAELLPFIEEMAGLHDFLAVVPLCAKDRDMVKAFEQSLLPYLPEGEAIYDPDQLTDRSDRFIAAEIVREKLMRALGQELPYATTVTIDAFEEEEEIIRIAAIIWVERDGQKSIVIGKKGERIKAMSTEARLDMQNYFEKKVFLNTWVKVKSGWSDSEQSLNQLGYTE